VRRRVVAPREFQKTWVWERASPAAAIRAACQQRNIDSLDRSPVHFDADQPGLTSSAVCWVAVALIVCFASAERRWLSHQRRRCTGYENSHLILPTGKMTGADESGIGLAREFPPRARSPMVRWESNETPPCRVNCKRPVDLARISSGCEYLVRRKSAGYSLGCEFFTGDYFGCALATDMMEAICQPFAS
jgi:hypothetical protein